MKSREEFRQALQAYVTSDPTERRFTSSFLELLKAEACYSRELTFGHLTASAWVLNHERDKILMIHHKKLDRWLQPGGHADGDENLARVAAKELREETGLYDYELYTEQIFDLDIHKIPKKGDVEEHDHFDVRFLFLAHEEATIEHNEESHAVSWVPFDQIPDETSMQRMLIKTKRLFNLR